MDETNLGKRRSAALRESNNPLYHERHQGIVDAAARVFLRKGYEDATLKDIAEEVGIDRATLYYYASSKKYLFDEVLSQSSEKNIRYIEDVMNMDINSREKVTRAISRLVQSYNEDYPYLAIFVQKYMHSSTGDGGGAEDHAASGEGSDWGRRYYRALRAIVQEGKDRGEFVLTLPVGVATNALIGMVNWIQLARGPNPVASSTPREARLSPDELARELSSFMLRALGAAT